MKEALNDIRGKRCEVAILMATYNGERFLAEQIDSILSQSFTEWTLYVLDDLSPDTTPDILRHYAEKASRIRLVENREKLGAMRNFERLMMLVEADYYFFADQDDVWTADKIEASLEELQRVEILPENKGKAIALYTDLKVVDAELNEISPSFWQMQRIQPELLTSLPRLSAHNFATGCTMLFNATARREALPIPDKAYMHDAWLMLTVMRSGGIILHRSQPTVLYRQHSANVVGANDDTRHFLRNKMLHLRYVIRDNMKPFRMHRKGYKLSLLQYVYHKCKYHKDFKSFNKQ